jgi:hypothetical protein
MAQSRLPTAHIFGTTPADAQANWRGEIGPTQRPKLHQIFVRRREQWGRIAFLLLVLSLAMVIVQSMTTVIWIGLVPLIPLCVIDGIRLIAIMRDLNLNQVRYVDGPLTPAVGLGYAVRVAGLRLLVDEAEFHAFTPDQRYRLYYTPATRTVVRAERLDQRASKPPILTGEFHRDG